MADVLGWVVAAAVSTVAAVLAIPRELWKRWRERLTDHLDQTLRRGVSRFGRRYREFMLSSLRFIDLKGLATVGFFTPELDEVFVDVSLAYRVPGDIPKGLLTKLPPDVTGRHAIAEFLYQPQPLVLAVVGAPGSGKTTLLRHTARSICRDRQRVPILLYLRDHVADIVGDADLPSLVRGTLGRYAPDEPPYWFEQRLRDGACVVLLDGLDEVARQEDRRKVAGWVERQTRQYPKNDFVITSRPQGYHTAPVEGALVLQVRNFTDEQGARFIHGWYLAAEKHGTGASGGDDVRQRAESAAEDLLNRLNNAPSLYDLTVNPLLLTMIANVHRYRGALPGSRADLYGEICQVMLWRRHEAKNLTLEMSGDRKEALLRSLAFAMMERRVGDLPRAEVLRELKPAMNRISTRLSEEDFLADVSSNGLLVERENGVYSFAHLTFQEYLAAAYIRDKGLSRVLADAVEDEWWRETTVLYAASSDADQIVEACLDAYTVPAMALAFELFDQGCELAPELRNRLNSAFSKDSRHNDLRLFVGMRITRHLRHSIPTSAGTRVCTGLINTEIYGYFLLETDHPQRNRHEIDQETPATGVRASDADAFLRWVNSVTGGQPKYRLPTHEEIAESAVQRMLARNPGLSVWLHPDFELWTPTSSLHPNRIDAQMLANHVRSDFEQSKHTMARLLLLRARHHVRHHPSLVDYAVFRSQSLLGVRVNSRAGLVERLDYITAGALGSMGDSTLDHVLAIDSGPVTTVIIRVLRDILDNAMTREDPNDEAWLAALTQDFIAATGLMKTDCLISLDELMDNVSMARHDLTALTGPDTAAWIEKVADRMQRIAAPIVARETEISAGTATAIRFAALCLAAEADRHENPDVGDIYRRIAAGITLLERRATGLSPATETILLATG